MSKLRHGFAKTEKNKVHLGAVMRRLRRRLWTLGRLDALRQRWWDKHAQVTVVIEPDHQKSVFVYVPQYLKRYNVYHDIKRSLRKLEWPSKRVNVMYGNVMPRDIRWFQTRNKPYDFSGKRFVAENSLWPKGFHQLRKQLNEELNRRTLTLRRKCNPFFRACRVNSVLTNRYRGPRDSISAHSDNEPLFGRNPTIVSISLGTTRTFKLSRKTLTKFEVDRKWTRVRNPLTTPGPTKADRKKNLQYELGDGDLLIMAGAAQDWWEHRIDKDTSGTISENAIRYNMTWRRVVPNPPSYLPRRTCVHK
jgi:alkylated DNA repair dioxygenase AlkB